jgi:signal transduction histidine kinase/HAMP domain-containing protein
MTLRWRLLAAQGILALALLAVGVVAAISLRTLGRSAETILQDNYRSVLAAERIKEAAERLDHAALARVAGRAEEAIDPGPTWRRLEEELLVQEGNITERGERDATERLRQAWRAYQEAFRRVEAVRGREAQARAYFADLEPRYAAVRAAAQEILDINQDAMVGKAERARRQAASLILAVVAATGIGVLAGTLLASWVTTRVVRPVSVVAQAAQRIATGDLTARARVKGRDEIAALASEFNAMADKLAEYQRSSLGELLQAQQAAQAAIDGLPDPVLVLDVAGQVQNLNHASESVLRLPRDPGGDLVASLDPPLREVVERVRAHVLAGHGAWQPKGYEEAVRIDLADGARWLLPRATPLHSESGAVTGVAIVLQDVSRLMRVDELKNDLVATVAHEFRTPLTSLRMAIHLCVEEAAGPLSEKQADLLLTARQDCERLQGIVDDLLDLSRIQGGRMELLRRPVPARALLDEAVASARDAAAVAGIKLSVRGAVEDEVAVDAERVALVLSNLVSNAIRHTAASGEVVLEAALDGDRVRFEVRDSGEGIPGEYLERIFDRFFRVPGRGSGGVGLGLYLVREIVQAHGGQVGVESEPGKGSTFWFTLPVAEGEPAPG